MMWLSELIKILEPERVLNYVEKPVDNIRYTVKNINDTALFACIDEFLEYGQWMPGNQYLSDQQILAAAAILAAGPAKGLPMPQLIVKNPVVDMARAAKYLYGHPDERACIIGITGTNGKTTISQMMAHMLGQAGYTAASMGTIGIYQNGAKLNDALYTTPLSAELFRTLKQLVDAGTNAVAMEISSHALALERVFGLDVDLAVFSNISRDHLDFHQTDTAYAAAKIKLFARLKSTGIAVVNLDDSLAQRICAACPARVITYGLSESAADIRAIQPRYGATRTEFEILCCDRTVAVKTPLIGAFNVYNTLAVIAAGVGLEIPLETIVGALSSFAGVPGRMEVLAVGEGRTGIVDYAHTPDALANVLTTLKKMARARIITVFGCGGDRDRGKRPQMGRIASSLSDIAILTSDNPRTEDPAAIIADIQEGVVGNSIVIEPDRRRAIQEAYAVSAVDDIILVAGKGHEDYQIIGTQKHHFSDIEELRCL